MNNASLELTTLQVRKFGIPCRELLDKRNWSRKALVENCCISLVHFSSKRSRKQIYLDKIDNLRQQLLVATNIITSVLMLETLQNYLQMENENLSQVDDERAEVVRHLQNRREETVRSKHLLRKDNFTLKEIIASESKLYC